jgi:hypothetical protein
MLVSSHVTEESRQPSDTAMVEEIVGRRLAAQDRDQRRAIDEDHAGKPSSS